MILQKKSSGVGRKNILFVWKKSSIVYTFWQVPFSYVFLLCHFHTISYIYSTVCVSLIIFIACSLTYLAFLHRRHSYNIHHHYQYRTIHCNNCHKVLVYTISTVSNTIQINDLLFAGKMLQYLLLNFHRTIYSKNLRHPTGHVRARLSSKTPLFAG